MHSGSHSLLPAVAASVLVLVTSIYLLVGFVLHYAALSLAPASGWGFAAGALAAALLHERFVRGALYKRFQKRLAPGIAGVSIALVGAVAPLAARLLLLPRPEAPLLLVISQSMLVEMLISFALTWLALGSGATLPGGLALGFLWAVRFVLVATYHGGVVPFLEVIAAGAGALAVSTILGRALAPYRDQVLGAS